MKAVSYLRNSLYYRSYEGLSKDVWLLSLVMLVNRSGAMVAPFLSIYLISELDIGLTGAGIIMSCYGIGSLIGSMTGGILTDRFGYYYVQLTSLILTSISFVVLSTITDFYGLCLGFLFLSLFADTFRPANLTAIESFSKPENLTRSFSLVRMTINLGFTLGPMIGGLVAHHYNYTYLFYINGASLAMGALLYYFFFKSKKKYDSKTRGIKSLLNLPFSDTKYVLYLGFFTLVIMGFFQLFYTVPVFFKSEYLFSESTIGILMALNGLMIVIIEMPLIFKLEKRWKPISFIVLGCAAIAFALLFVAWFPAGLLCAILFTLIITMGEILSFPFSNTYALSFSGVENRGRYMGLYTMSFSLAHIITPSLSLFLIDQHGYNFTYAAYGLVAVLATAGIWGTTKMRKSPSLTYSGFFD